TWGDDIGWMSNGYSYPAYTEEDEKTLKDLMKVQHSYGLNITWVSPEEYNELVPGINKEGLRGSTYSPEDGSCSPLLLGSAYYFHSLEAKVQYRFREKVIGFDMSQSKIEKVITDKGTYSTGMVINAAGNYGKEIAAMAGLNLPVQPENHEAGITEPVARFMGPMVVDMRIRPGSENFYFYQNNEGQIVFCITPKPPITGIDNRSTSVFLPMCTKRMLEVYPRLHSLRVRRTWRGQYPMTPDGFPIVGKSGDSLINAIGMCGQGFMLGPGLGELITRICLDELTESDLHILQSFNPERDFSGMEAFK
ncbi:MAG TPA: FAD-binding oxidoreductase, partial [Candidatus Syntrophosphaera thermopropionivorans]|nr:FAD-binding oxidoreductase [Candidatus Syntrophosphaera thermopropionivorans]